MLLTCHNVERKTKPAAPQTEHDYWEITHSCSIMHHAARSYGENRSQQHLCFSPFPFPVHQYKSYDSAPVTRAAACTAARRKDEWGNTLCCEWTERRQISSSEELQDYSNIYYGQQKVIKTHAQKDHLTWLPHKFGNFKWGFTCKLQHTAGILIFPKCQKSF